MKGIVSLFLLVMLGFTLLVNGQTFSTETETKIIGKKDIVQISYVADNVDLQQLSVPKFINWVVISGPNVSSSTIVINGSAKQSTTYTFILQPTTTGKLVVPGATALINGKPKQSNSLVIEVKNQDHLLSSANPPSQQPPQTSLFDLFPMEDDLPSGQFLKKGESAINKIKNNILVRLELSKNKCFVGEPIVATYKLCTRLKSKSKVVKQPMFTGCTVVELTDNEMSSHIEKINGLEYNVFVVRRVQLIPLHAGTLQLPEAQVENKVSFYDASKINYRDLFYDRSRVPIEEQSVTLSNKVQTIEVKAIPSAPANFSGAIGSFNIGISTNNQTLTTTDNNKLQIAINGVGNLQNMKPLSINWPTGLEGFEPQDNIEMDKSLLPVQVTKNIIFPFTAEKKGTFIISPVPFVYFDPLQEKYITKTTPSFAIQILPGNKKIVTGNALSDFTSLQNVGYIIAGAGILILLVGLFWYNTRKKTKSNTQNEIEKIEVEEVTAPVYKEDYVFRLKLLEPNEGGSDFYKRLLKILQTFLQENYTIETSQIPTYIAENPEKAAEMQQLKLLADKCNLVMYTPMYETDEAMQDKQIAIEIISKLQ